MRIQGDGNAVSDLLVFLTRDEAAELSDGLEDLLANFDDPGWPAHVSNPDFQIEMTIAPETLSNEIRCAARERPPDGGAGRPSAGPRARG